MMLKGSTKIHDFAPHKRSDQLPYALKGHQDTAYLFGLYVFQDRKHFLSYKAIYIDISVACIWGRGDEDCAPQIHTPHPLIEMLTKRCQNLILWVFL